MNHQQQTQQPVWLPKHVNKRSAIAGSLLIAALSTLLLSADVRTGSGNMLPLHGRSMSIPSYPKDSTSGMCFDDQPSDMRTMARMVCNDPLPKTNYDLGAFGETMLQQQVNQQDAATKPPSSVAICVVGKNRSFDSILAQESLRTNVASAFGATHTAFYFHLFTRDKRGDSSEEWSGEHATTVQESLDAALRVLRMKEGDFVRQHQRDELEEYHHWVSESCGAEIVIDNREDADVFQSNMKPFRGSKPLKDFTKMIHNRDEAFLRGFVAQWRGVKDCYDFVQRQEEQMGHKFDYVIRTRPDMVYSRSMYPHCMYSQKNVWSAHDWMFVFPRRVMDHLNQVYEEGIMNDSNPAFAGVGGENPESYMWRMVNLASESMGTDRCCDFGFQRSIKRHDEMVGGAMVLRPQGPKFPRNVCDFHATLIPHGQDLGFNPCMDLLQFNRYNVPFWADTAIDNQ